jgi:hypothetical protein
MSSVHFINNGTQAVVYYRDGNVYLVDTDQPTGASNASDALTANDLIRFICKTPLRSGFLSDDDAADVAKALNGADPRACGEKP